MPTIIYEYLTEDNNIIRIEATDEYKQSARGRADDIIKKVEQTFESSLSAIKVVANSLKKVLEEVSPDETSVEFSLKASGEAGFFSVCRAATEAEFKITLTWKGEKDKKEA